MGRIARRALKLHGDKKYRAHCALCDAFIIKNNSLVRAKNAFFQFKYGIITEDEYITAKNKYDRAKEDYERKKKAYDQNYTHKSENNLFSIFSWATK